MKQLFIGILISFFAVSAFAEEEYNVTQTSFESLVNLYAVFGQADNLIPNLSCVSYPLNFEEDGSVTYRSFTVLQNSKPLAVENAPVLGNVELGWRPATVEGCNLEALESVFEIAPGRYMFVPATYTITKETSKVPRKIEGKCVYSYHETIKVDLGFGLILNSHTHASFKHAPLGCQ